MEAPWEILVASSELEIGQSIVTILARLGVKTFSAVNVAQCREVLAKQTVGLIFCSRRFPDGTYQDVVTLAQLPGTDGKKNRPIVLAAAYIDPTEYHQAKQLGVFDIVTLPCQPTAIEWIVIQAIRQNRDGEGRRQILARPTLALATRPASAIATRPSAAITPHPAPPKQGDAAAPAKETRAIAAEH